MAKVDYEQVVQVLRSRLGAQYEGMEADGRDDMKDVLKSELGYSDDQADEAIDAMVASGTLRYQRATSADDVDRGDATDEPAIGAIPAVPATAGAGPVSNSGTPIIPVPIGAGYWQIGAGDETEGGRKGQVNPV